MSGKIILWEDALLATAELIPFSFHAADVRVHLDENSAPWWVLSDVCSILGLTNTSKVASQLKPYESKTLTLSYTGQTVRLIIVNESGLYRLVMRSRKAEAELFQQWVFAEVLPQIRKTGQYQVQRQPRTQIQILQESIQVLAEIEARQQRLETAQQEQAAQIAALQAAVPEPLDQLSIRAFGKLHAMHINTKMAQTLGRQCTDTSKKHGREIGRMPDALYGSINTYDRDILEEVFTLYFGVFGSA